MAGARRVGTAFVEAFNAHDEQRIRELNAERAVLEAPGGVHVEGGEAATQYAMGWVRAFPDARIVLRNEIEAADWVIQEFTFEGTHTEPLAGPTGEIPATGRRLSGRGVQIFRVDGDSVVDTRLYFDQVEVMTQLGLMPELAPA
jgi:predicted ester cyclase